MFGKDFEAAFERILKKVSYRNLVEKYSREHEQ